ncbi:MAG: response regulator [Myxococcales bacterium]|nr:response regulator [Myxococcales bacterium]
MAEKPQTGKIATFGVRFETHDHFLVEYTDHLRRGFLVLPGVSTLSEGQPVRIKLALPNRAILYLTGTSLGAGHPDAAGRGTLVRLASYNDEQKRILDLCVSAVIDEGDTAPVAPTLSIEVLLVEDNDSIRAEMTSALLARGLKVRVAENGLVAISSALKAEPDVILTDVEMPVMDGWTLLRMARSRKRLAHLPIVFLTSLSDEMSRLQGYRMGVDDYLPKALPPDEIVARLQSVLARRGKQDPGTDASSSGLRGDLRHVGLGSVLSFLEAEKKTGDLRVENGSDHAVLRIVHGFLRDVRNLGRCVNHQERVFELLGWKGGSFEFVSLPESQELDQGPMPPTPMTYLLMEYARREDEASAIRSGLK